MEEFNLYLKPSKNKKMIRNGYIAVLLSFLNIFVPLDSLGAELTLRKEIEGSFVVLLNNNGVIPITALEKGRFAIVTIGQADVFASRLNDYFEMPVVRIDAHSHESMESGLSELLKYDRIIAGISAAALPLNHDYRTRVNKLVQILGERESVAVFFGPPLFLAWWRGLENIDGLLVAREDGDMVQDLAAQLVFGGIGASGTLPEAAGDFFPVGWGMRTAGGLRLKYTIPEEVGLDSRIINHRVDSIVNLGLDLQAFPGCRVLVAKGGKVILDRVWGYHTYSGRIAVKKDDLYDLASITKISGPLPLYMKLVDQGALDLTSPLSRYWEDWRSHLFRRSNKEDLTLLDLLTHQSGLTPYINYWEQTVRRGNYIRRWYRHERLDGYSVELGSHLYLRDNIRKRVYREIRRSKLFPHGEYRYSCLPFIVSPEVIERIDGRPYTEALYEDFYKPLGAVSLRYNPRNYFPDHRIVPTEVDRIFRRKLVHGYVHDESAAVLNGVSGNAGLFSSAGDLAKLLQMYLNGGEYGGRRYLSQEVLNQFTTVQFPENNNRRGIGFDKPVLDNSERSPERTYPCPGASSSSFGHSGFTGTFVWMDPEHDLLYIFLSNRVHPTRDNNLISTLNIRTEVLQVFYDAISRQIE
jgi:CubicO group peptidase (beta-lactamase class C family)